MEAPPLARSLYRLRPLAADGMPLSLNPKMRTLGLASVGPVARRNTTKSIAVRRHLKTLGTPTIVMTMTTEVT